MQQAIIIHTVSILVAFFVSFFVFYNQKGTGLHKILGRIFGSSMLISAISSFFIRSNGNFSWIHILSILTIYWLGRAIWATRVKPKNWMYIHASNMSNAFIGIIIAGTGVIVRHYIFVGDKKAWIVASVIVAAITVPFMVRATNKYKKPA